MFLVAICLCIFNNSFFINDFLWISWYDIYFFIILVNLIWLFVTWRIFYYKNYFDLLGFIFLWVLGAGLVLFILQFEAFACIILLSELVLLMFGLFNIISINSQQLHVTTHRPLFLISIGVLGFYPLTTHYSTYYNFFIYFYKTITFSYNDFLQLFLVLYIENLTVLLLIGLFLLFLTIYLLILFFSSNSYKKSTYIDNVARDQSFWEQIKKKTFIKFF